MRMVMLVLVLLLSVTVPAVAQITLVADRFFFVAGPRQLAGSGDPEGSVTAPPGSTYHRTNGSVYIKASGSGNTGWSVLTTIAGTLPVGSGGTGATSFTLNGVLYGNSTSPILVTAAPGANVVLAGNSSAPFFTSTPTASQFIATTSVVTPDVTSTGNLGLLATGDLIIDPTGNDVLPFTNYDINLGAPTLKYLSLRAAELIVDTLVAQDVIATIGGRVVVAPTTTLTADLAAATTTITVKHNQIANGDRLRLEARGNVEFLAVTSAAGGSAGAYTYSITRNLDGTGANDWIRGDAVLNTGTTGDGFIDLYATSGVLGSAVGPAIVGSVRTGTTYSQVAPRWAVGNLNAVGYGHSSDIYGFAAGNPSATSVYIDDTNGFVIQGVAGVKVQITPSGDASFSGTVTAAAGAIGGWTIAADQLYSGTGVNRAGLYTGGAHTIRFYAGDESPSAAPFRVDRSGALTATSATITGALTATSGNITGALQADSITTAMLQANSVTAAKVAADQISATHLTADSVTSAKILANTIVAADIAAATITATELAADSVTSAKIVAGTIVASDIAASTITADKLSVTTLSAISADIGTVTAGIIDGVTIHAGSSDEVILDSSGVTLTNGTGTNNRVKWNDGSYIQSSADVMTLEATEVVINNLSVLSNFTMGSTSTMKSFAFDNGGTQFLCVDNSGVFFVQVAACAAPDARVSALEQRIEALEQQIDTLKAAIAAICCGNRP